MQEVQVMVPKVPKWAICGENGLKMGGKYGPFEVIMTTYVSSSGTVGGVSVKNHSSLTMLNRTEAQSHRRLVGGIERLSVRCD